MIKIAVVDDDEMFLNQMEIYAAQYARERKRQIEIARYLEGSQLLADYHPFDIIFLDIQMKEIDGIETAHHIRKIDQNVLLLFITNMAQYAINGYEVDALDYILKPVNYYIFSVRMDRAISRLKKHRSRELILPLSNGVCRLQTEDIYYVEIQNRTLCYHTRKGEFMVHGTISAVERELAEYHFVRCNHWYLVNLKHVTQVEGNLAVVGEEKLEISQRKRTVFLSALMDYISAE